MLESDCSRKLDLRGINGKINLKLIPFTYLSRFWLMLLRFLIYILPLFQSSETLTFTSENGTQKPLQLKSDRDQKIYFFYYQIQEVKMNQNQQQQLLIQQQQQLKDFSGIIIKYGNIEIGIKEQYQFLYKDIELYAIDQFHKDKIYQIRLFNDQIYYNFREFDCVVFQNSIIYKEYKNINKIKLEFVRGQSRLLVSDEQILRYKGSEYLLKIKRKQQMYRKKVQGLCYYFSQKNI